MSIQVNIADEANGRQIYVILTSEQYERAQRDTEYVQQLVHDYDANMHSRETESLPNEPTEQYDTEYVQQLVHDYDANMHSRETESLPNEPTEQYDTEYVQQLVHDYDANMHSRETESLPNEPTEQYDTEYVQQLVHDYDANMHSRETESLPNEPTEQYDTEYVQQLVHDYDANMHSRETESLPNEPTEQYVDREPPSIFIWNEACILLLLTLYSEHKEHFEKMRHKSVYEIIARKMRDMHYNVNASQCQSKINSLKKIYKKIMDHNATSGNDRATWPYFDRMNELFGSAGWANPVALASEIGPTPVTSHTHENSRPQTTEPRKRKFDSILEDYRKDMKKYREERSKQKQDNFNKYLLMKERQHKEKMEILQTLCSNNNN